MAACVRAGLTLTEAQNINRSLLELGNVISALMQQSAHVPYRCGRACKLCCPRQQVCCTSCSLLPPRLHHCMGMTEYWM